ncbi:MAG: hypothetical protein JRI34_00795 [Deltaproteobacteria bacterium]|nr:hypothetical protein [Deltaproteobacteria bacterium]
MVLHQNQPQVCVCCGYDRPGRFPSRDYERHLQEVHAAARERVDSFRAADALAGQCGRTRKRDAVHGALANVARFVPGNDWGRREPRELAIRRAQKELDDEATCADIFRYCLVQGGEKGGGKCA